MNKFLTALLAVGLIASGVSAHAGGRYGGHDYGGWRGHSHYYGGHYRPRTSFGVHIGIPLVWPSVGYTRVVPYPYAYPAYPSTQVVIERQPQVYVQREAAATAAPASSAYWYYCPDSQTYYPYAQTCPSAWLQVVPQTSPQGAR